MKNEILILGIFIIIVGTLGCTNNLQSKKQSEGNINFQMPDGWELHPMPGEGTVIWMGNDPRIRVIELKDKQKFESKYKIALELDKDVYDVKAVNKTIEGVEVRIIKTMNLNYGDIQDEYFFQKNNKYYYVMSWAFTGWNSGMQRTSRTEVDTAIDTIVKTIS